MNHASSVTLRVFGHCSRSAGASWPQPSQLLFRAFHSTKIPSSPAQLLLRSDLLASRRSVCGSHYRKNRIWSLKQLSPSQRSCFSTSSIFQRLKPYPEEGESGLTFRKEHLSIDELAIVFPDISISTGPSAEVIDARRGEDTLTELDLEDYNRLLRVLHARRVDGTIDLPITDPALLYILETFPDSQEAALAWLRHTYPVDEDEAILARFRREEAPREQENPSALTERGQRMGLLRMQDASAEDYYGPQSGAYYAELSEKGNDDVFGRSQLERIRKENEAKFAEEERIFEERVDESLRVAEAKAEAARAEKLKKTENKNTALEKQTGKDLELADTEREIRPPNSFEKWVIKAQDRAVSRLTLESPEIVNMTLFQRLFPSFAFVLVGCIAVYLYAQTWEAPRRSDRWLPDMSLALATCTGLLAANFAIFLLWRFPPARGWLNRYFIVSPAWPYATSCLGNTFSHWSFRHLSMNMLSLFIFGPALHEEIGRGNFIGIYLAAGMVGSFFSLSSFALRGILYTTSQGASGSIWGIMGAYLWLHKDDNFSFIFIPKEYQNSVLASGWMILVPLVILDLVSGIRAKTIDVVAHQAGLAVGIVTSQLWKNEHGHEQRQARFGFIQKLLGRGSEK